jgi:DNA-binding transcriptional ArsR family regulator
MDLRALHSEHLFAAGVLVASTLVLALQLVNPSPVVVRLGENGTEVAELGGYFRYRDVGVVTVAACLLGASGTYLLTSDPDAVVESNPTDGAVDVATPPTSDDGRPVARADGAAGTPAERFPDDGDEPDPSDELLEARRREWEEKADRLANNEAEVYELLLDADGVLPQAEIVDESDLSKATVSRTLDSLETKDLVERKRRGMGNVVLLQ